MRFDIGATCNTCNRFQKKNYQQKKNHRCRANTCLLYTSRGVKAAVVAGPEGSKEPRFRRLSDIWAIFQTFVFITFTRLFFRSGSNLDPAEANETAWNTAKNMVNRIGSNWDLSVIPQIVWQYRNVFLLVVIGMAIHWLPDRFKRRYRIWFASIPVSYTHLDVYKRQLLYNALLDRYLEHLKSTSPKNNSYR